MEQLERGFLAGDFTYAFEILYSPLVQTMGGRERALAAARAINAQMKEQRVVFLSWKARKPYQYVSTAVRRYALVPCEARLKVGGKRVLQSSYQLGIEVPGTGWQFINGDKLSPQVYQELFPDFPKTVKLPKVTRLAE